MPFTSVVSNDGRRSDVIPHVAILIVRASIPWSRLLRHGYERTRQPSILGPQTRGAARARDEPVLRFDILYYDIPMPRIAHHLPNRIAMMSAATPSAATSRTPVKPTCVARIALGLPTIYLP